MGCICLCQRSPGGPDTSRTGWKGLRRAAPGCTAGVAPAGSGTAQTSAALASGAKGAGSFLHRSCQHGSAVTGRRAQSGRGGPVWVNHRESVGAKAPRASWERAERPGPALDPPLPVRESWLCRQVPAGIHCRQSWAYRGPGGLTTREPGTWGPSTQRVTQPRGSRSSRRSLVSLGWFVQHPAGAGGCSAFCGVCLKGRPGLGSRSAVPPRLLSVVPQSQGISRGRGRVLKAEAISITSAGLM